MKCKKATDIFSKFQFFDPEFSKNGGKSGKSQPASARIWDLDPIAVLV
jgi:hypothetical protein